MDEIKNVQELFENYLGKTKQIQDYKIKRLTAAGENYGSIMLSLDLLVNNNGIHETLSTVVKKIPTDEILQKVFHTNLTFPNEIAFYKMVFPTMQQFLKNNNINEIIDFFPKYYGSRYNSDNTNKIDEDAILILENLKNDYINLPRRRGCCYGTTKLVLEALAKFHGTLLALRLKQEALFNDNIRPYILKFDLFDNKKNPFDNTENDEETRQSICETIGKIEQISQYRERVKNALFNRDYTIKNENYATIIHNDLWTNNIMVKFVNKHPTDIKIIDYQICTYGSIARDLLFYLFTSVQNDICRNYLDNLIRYYYDNFIDILKKFNCNLDNYSYDQFLNEIKIEAKNTQLNHILMMLIPILAIKPLENDKLTMDPDNISEELKTKLQLIIEEFVKRNWI